MTILYFDFVAEESDLYVSTDPDLLDYPFDIDMSKSSAVDDIWFYIYHTYENLCGISKEDEDAVLETVFLVGDLYKDYHDHKENYKILEKVLKKFNKVVWVKDGYH